ncbi:HEPN domain-containing protein, partial [Aureibaculum luteum]|uniref:HEPN domain-containing protein n=1 Tax=Aureibaculum luteum TaxID=1548456 RepID=UPI000E4FDEC4
VKGVNVNQIYLTLGEKNTPFKYRFTIIIEDMAKRFKESTKAVLDACIEEYPDCYAKFFTLHYIQNETNNGNTFFLNHCLENRLVYCHNSYDKNWLFNKIDFSKVIKTARLNFIKRKHKISAFKKGADLFLSQGNYGQATFMLHQTIEQSFIAAEHFLMGASFTGHLISDHQMFVGKVNPVFGNIFSKKNKRQINLLNKLNKAYSKSRYALNYKISKKQVEKIYKRANVLIDFL